MTLETTEIAPEPSAAPLGLRIFLLVGKDNSGAAVLPRAEWDEAGVYEPVIVRGVD